jgi:hypothetical protein
LPPLLFDGDSIFQVSGITSPANTGRRMSLPSAAFSIANPSLFTVCMTSLRSTLAKQPGCHTGNANRPSARSVTLLRMKSSWSLSLARNGHALADEHGRTLRPVAAGTCSVAEAAQLQAECRAVQAVSPERTELKCSGWLRCLSTATSKPFRGDACARGQPLVG